MHFAGNQVKVMLTATGQRYLLPYLDWFWPLLLFVFPVVLEPVLQSLNAFPAGDRRQFTHTRQDSFERASHLDDGLRPTQSII